MSMSSVAERVGFELVAELIQGLWVWFALELREFFVKKIFTMTTLKIILL
jgi:hypothetical protein